MENLIRICLIICFVSAFAFAQSQPFEGFDKAVKEEKAGFSGNKENLSKVFNQERIKLGKDFETELWKYLGEDADKYYWISFFINSKSYLHGNMPLPELAFQFRQKALELLENKDDEKSLGRTAALSRLLAVAAQKLGKQDLAVNYKNKAESLLGRNKEFNIYVTAMSEYDSCIYKNLEKDTSICKQESEMQTPKEIIINGGILNGKAISLPFSEYPEKGRAKKLSGLVSVKILIDVDGKVISAEGFEGHPEFFEAAIKAAKKAKFKPTKLSDKPVKVSGVLVYRFIF